MPILFDAHTHIYPCFSPANAFRNAIRNFKRLETSLHPLCNAQAKQIELMVFLTERSSENYFRGIEEGKFGEVTKISPALVRVNLSDRDNLYVVSGKQINTAERIEVHALGTTASFSDGAPIEETITRIIDYGAHVALPWGIGKWLFKRGEIVNRLLERFSPRELILSDSAARSWAFGAPNQFSQARAKRFSTIAGTDPLPLTGEELRIGSYATLFTGEFDFNSPEQSFRNMFSDPEKLVAVGKRQGVVAMARGLVRLRVAQRCNSK